MYADNKLYRGSISGTAHPSLVTTHQGKPAVAISDQQIYIHTVGSLINREVYPPLSQIPHALHDRYMHATSQNQSFAKLRESFADKMRGFYSYSFLSLAADYHVLERSTDLPKPVVCSLRQFIILSGQIFIPKHFRAIDCNRACVLRASPNQYDHGA